MPRTLPRWLKVLLPFVGLAFFLFLIYTIDLRKIIDAFLSIDARYILVALSLTVPVLVIRIYAWQWICRSQEIHIGGFRLLKIYLIGLFYGVGTPGYLGQIMRVPYMKGDTNAPYGKLFVNVVLETFVHTLSLYAMMVCGAILVVGMLPQLLWLTVVWILGVLAVFLYLVKKERGDRLFQGLVRLLIPQKVRGQVSSFTETFYLDFPRLRLLAVPLLLGALTWVLVFTQEYFIVLALGLPIPYLVFLLLYPVANVAGFLPVSIAGLGTREFTAIAIFTALFAVSRADVFVVSVAGFIVTDVFLAGVGFGLSFTEARQSGEGIEGS